jgi:hypothetical protein
MRVPTANVIIGFNREVMDRLFTDGATYKSLIQGLTKKGDLDDVLLFDNESNPNFISFEHSLLGGDMRMKLTFIDPKGEFERRFMSDNIPRNLAGFSYNTEVYNKYTYEKQVPSQEDADPISKKATDEVKQSQMLYDKQFFSELQKKMEEHYGERRFYVAYGSGSNLDLWSGPHRTVLTNAEIVVKGARKITIELTPTETPVLLSQRRGAYNEKVDLDLAGLTMRYSGISKPIEFTKILKNERAYDPLTYLGLEDLAVAGIEGGVETVYKNRTDISEALDKIGLLHGGAASELGQFDFHSIIVDALRSYVQKATGNPNVIILLPNINVTCRQSINDSIVNARKVKTTLESGASKMPLFGTFITEAVKSYYGADTLLRQGLGYKENFMSNFLNSFGLGLHQVLKDYANSSGDLKAIPSHKISALQHYEKNTNAEERFKDYFDVHNFYAIVQKASNKGIPNHVDVLKTIIEKINKNAKEDYQIEWVVYNETDIKLLNFWGGSNKTLPTHKFPTFGGYREFNTQKEAVIIGDKALIQQYLYGKIDLDNKFKTIQEYETAAVLAKENQNKYESDLAKQGPAINPFAKSFGPPSPKYTSTLSESLEASATEQAEIYKEGIIGAVKAIPLHPLDAIILTNKSYNKAVREIAFPPITSVGSFGDISDIPDTFGYSDKEFTNTEKDYIKKQGIPIFRYNTTNPNILDLTFKFSGIYFGALKSGFVTAVQRKASAVAEGVLPIGIGSLPIRTRGAAIAYLRQKNFSLNSDNRAEIIAGLKGKVSIELMESLQATDPSQAAGAIAAILEKAEKGDDADLKGIIEIDQRLPGNPQSIMTDFTEKLYRDALSINIKTLPLFHVSNVSHLSSPCIVFAQDAPIKQSVDAESTLLNSFFSGLYMIMGFKHTINTSTATSEFSLTKNAPKFEEEETTE